MPYNINDKGLLSKVDKIIQLHEEVLVEHYVKKYIAEYYFIRSLEDIKNLFKKATDQDIITIYKKKQLLCRGILGPEFKEKVLTEYNNKEYDYAFYKNENYPVKLEEYAIGSGVIELNQQLDSMIEVYKNENALICFGEDPRPLISSPGIDESENIIVVSGTGVE